MTSPSEQSRSLAILGTFSFRDNVGEGDCLFHAVLGKTSVFPTVDHTVLRHQVFSDHGQEYRNFQMIAYQALSSQLNQHLSLEQYNHIYRNTGNWTGSFEMTCLYFLYGVNIISYPNCPNGIKLSFDSHTFDPGIRFHF